MVVGDGGDSTSHGVTLLLYFFFSAGLIDCWDLDFATFAVIFFLFFHFSFSFLFKFRLALTEDFDSLGRYFFLSFFFFVCGLG